MLCFTLAIAKVTSIQKQQNSIGILSFEQSWLVTMAVVGEPFGPDSYGVWQLPSPGSQTQMSSKRELLSGHLDNHSNALGSQIPLVLSNRRSHALPHKPTAKQCGCLVIWTIMQKPSGARCQWCRIKTTTRPKHTQNSQNSTSICAQSRFAQQ